MERKSSFKECPKCGLRNKPSATQCDFCGQNLGSSDDWQQHIRDLESLNKVELRRPMDDRTSKRIASTIIRKDSPAAHTMGIKEAGNVGKALRELDEETARDKGRDARDEYHRQPAAQEKLSIREAGPVPLVEDEESHLQEREGNVATELVEEPSRFSEANGASEAVSAVPAVTEPEIGQVASADIALETAPMEGADDDTAEETLDKVAEPDLPPQPVKEDEQIPEVSEPILETPEEVGEPSAVPEEMDEVVPANEVTLKVVRSPTDEVPPIESVGSDEEEVTVSSNASNETIRLKLVEVERLQERPVPMGFGTHALSSGTVAIAALAVGSVAYLVVLALTAVGLLGVAEGLGGGAMSSFMIIYGAAVVFPSLRKKGGDEVFICPKCHEKVEENFDGCPACGIEFSSED